MLVLQKPPTHFSKRLPTGKHCGKVHIRQLFHSGQFVFKYWCMSTIFQAHFTNSALKNFKSNFRALRIQTENLTELLEREE